jgi:hypothetical protein
MDRLWTLQLAMPKSREFMMVGREADELGEQDIYIALPNKDLLRLFDGFEVVAEKDLPKQIDVLLYAEHTSGKFEELFTFRDARERWADRRQRSTK